MTDFSCLTLNEFEAAAWSMLQAAVQDRNAAWHLVNVATLGLDGAPKVRALVLRYADHATHTVRLHTDCRSVKVQELLANPAIEIQAYDPATHLQFRLSGEAVVHAVPAQVAQNAWDKATAQGRTTYTVTDAPGQVIEAGDAYLMEPVIKDESHPGQSIFRVIEVQAKALELVSLKHRANRRARFTYEDGRIVTSNWMVP